MADNSHSERHGAPQTPAAHTGATVIPFPPRPARRLAPPFDHNNPVHVAAWEALFEFGMHEWRTR